jgi:hypothetical protein
MGVRVRAAHDRPFVLNATDHLGIRNVEHGIANLKNLDIFDTFLCSSQVIYANPLVYDSLYVCYRESSDCEIMPRVKYEDITGPVNRFYGKERMGRSGC